MLGWTAAVLLGSVLVPLAGAVTADHLIIAEANWPGTRAPRGSQAIKLVNPTGSAIAMDNVYLTDATLSPNTVYYNITLTSPATANPGGAAAQDFHVRFPVGYSIAAGDTVVIAVNGSDEYEAEYGVTPDFELIEDGLAPDAVPELAPAFPGSVNIDLSLTGTSPVLDRTAESLVLYTWDGSSDLVADLDYVFWGTNENARINKTGVTIGASTYLADTSTGSQIPAATSLLAGQSLRRSSDDEGDGETDGAAGNGLTGHDETGEDLSATFGVQNGWMSASAPVAAAPAAPVVTADETVPAIPHAGSATDVSIALESFSAVTAVTFHYAVDGGADNTVSGTDNAGTWSSQIPQQSEGAVVTWWAEAVNSDGGTALFPVSAPIFVNSFTVQAEPVSGAGAEKLLITEVNAGVNIYSGSPFTGMEQLAMEFIEIHNPNAYEVDLSDYYLTDGVFYGSSTSQLYWQIALGNPSYDTVGGGNYNDFHARFPDGYTMAAGATITISIAGSDWFNGVYGEMPDLELYEDGTSADAIPDMRPVYGPADDQNSIHDSTNSATGTDQIPRGIPELEEHYGEPVILYHWVEGADLVTDVDFFGFGPSATGTYPVGFKKTGVTIGASSYQPDTDPANQRWHETVVEDGVQSYQRNDLTEGDQTASGGNGVDGRDETSEDMATTFEIATAAPGTLEVGGGNGGGGEPTGDAAKLLMTEISFGPNVYPFQSIEDFSQDFVEIYNPNDFDVDMSDYYLTDATSHFVEVRFGGSAQVYYQIANGAINRDRLGGGDYSDFFGRFPDGFTIGAGEIIVVSIAPADLYEGVFGMLPDVGLYETADHTSAAPVMRDVFSNSRWGGDVTVEDDLPELDEHYGETLVLFYWDGESDLVTDVDFFANGTSKDAEYSVGFDKSGVTSGASTYANETSIADQAWYADVVEDAQNSYQRVIADEGDQTATGGNGVGGRDETSEDFVVTFAPAPYTPGTWEFAGTGGGGEGEEATLQFDMQARTFMPRSQETFPFRFKVTASDFEFRLRIFDQEGRLVRTMYDSRFDDPILPGIFKTVEWDGRNDTYELVRAGLYIAHFSIVDIETGNEETELMPVVVASRLDK